MNAETRAKELYRAILYAPDFKDAKPLILATLRQAENDKLEEAAAAASGMALRAIDDGSPRGQVAAAVAFAVRSLKKD